MTVPMLVERFVRLFTNTREEQQGMKAELTDIVEYARLDVLRESLTMEQVLGRDTVPGDGVFSVG